MIDITKPLMFEKDNSFCKFIRLVGTLTDGSIIIEVEKNDKILSIVRFNSDGKLYGYEVETVRLINIPEPPMEFWVNVYDFFNTNLAYKSEEEAITASKIYGSCFIKCIHVREVK